MSRTLVGAFVALFAALVFDFMLAPLLAILLLGGLHLPISLSALWIALALLGTPVVMYIYYSAARSESVKSNNRSSRMIFGLLVALTTTFAVGWLTIPMVTFILQPTLSREQAILSAWAVNIIGAFLLGYLFAPVNVRLRPSNGRLDDGPSAG